jgi:predicted tellurium resistance membrane protein TerC
LSIPLVVWGSKIVLTLMQRFPWIVVAGGGLLGYLAGEMIQTDPVAAPFWATLGTPPHLLAWVGVVLVIGIGKVLTWRMANKSDPA